VTRENKILVKNSMHKRVVLTLEPWGEQYILEPGLLVELRQIVTNEIEPIEIEYLDAGITIYTGGVVTVFCNDRELQPEKQWIDRID
jgi:hypothetical protein